MYSQHCIVVSPHNHPQSIEFTSCFVRQLRYLEIHSAYSLVIKRTYIYICSEPVSQEEFNRGFTSKKHQQLRYFLGFWWTGMQNWIIKGWLAGKFSSNKWSAAEGKVLKSPRPWKNMCQFLLDPSKFKLPEIMGYSRILRSTQSWESWFAYPSRYKLIDIMGTSSSEKQGSPQQSQEFNG